MPQDAFTINHTAAELNERLCNARIDKVNQPTPDTVVFYVRTRSKNEKLLISANAETARIVVTDSQKEAPISAPAFCMLLRKHLSHAVIETIEALPFERIVRIKFATKNELRESGTKILYVEIMGKYSNITLTENGKILGAIKQSQTLEGIRPIFPGVTYKLPASQEKIELSDTAATLFCLKNFCGDDFADFIFNNFKGLSKATAYEIVYKFFGNLFVTSSDVKNINIADFYEHFQSFYDECNIRPNVTVDNFKSEFFVTEYKSVKGDKKYYDTINSAIDFYYENKENFKAFSDKKRKLTDAVKAHEKKLNKKYQIAEEKILSCNDMQNNRIFGELIISNLYRIKNGVKSVELENYYSPDNEKVTIKLDETLSPKQNAERYFKRYNKEKKTLIAVEPQITEIRENLKYVRSLYDEIDLAKELSDFVEIEEELIECGILKSPRLKTKRKKEIPSCRIYNYKGFEILVGKNNVQNTRLTMSAERNDMWLHVKDYHSAHVIIKAESRQIPDEVILYAAEICAYYSKANESDKVPVDYTLRKFVKRPAGLPSGMVYYSENKTVLVTPSSHEKT